MRLDFFVEAQFITKILNYIQKVHRTLWKETNVHALEIQDFTIHRYAKVISSRTDRHDESSVKIANN